jgi:hypothetical protein
MGFMSSKILFIGNLLGLKYNHQMRKYFRNLAKEGPTVAMVHQRGLERKVGRLSQGKRAFGSGK